MSREEQYFDLIKWRVYALCLIAAWVFYKT